MLKGGGDGDDYSKPVPNLKVCIYMYYVFHIDVSIGCSDRSNIGATRRNRREVGTGLCIVNIEWSNSSVLIT